VGSLKLWKPRGKKRWVGLRRSAATNSTPANIAAAPLNRISVDDDTIVSLLTPTLLSNGLNNSSSYGGSEAVVRKSWRLELGSELPLFTELPRRRILGNSGMTMSRMLFSRFSTRWQARPQRVCIRPGCTVGGAPPGSVGAAG
jgi:hypothetical protein